MMPGNRARTVDETVQWLTENVRIDDNGCHVWAGSTSNERAGGYPVVNWNYKRYLARRLLLELTGTSIPHRHVVYSTCGNRKCMNREHLRVGTKTKAMGSHSRRGAFLSGARRSLASAVGRGKAAKLPITERDTVLRLRSQGKTLSEIGALYGVTGSSVGHALKNWRRAAGNNIGGIAA